MRCERQEKRDIGVEKQVVTSPERLLFLSPAGAGGGLASTGRAFKARRPGSDPHLLRGASGGRAPGSQRSFARTLQDHPGPSRAFLGQIVSWEENQQVAT